MTGPGVHADAGELAQAAARLFIAAAAEAIRERGGFTVALAGGSTPKAMYAALAARPGEVDWGRTEVFFGDERCVPPEHADSNFRTAHEALLSRVALPAGHIHRMRGELGPRPGADQYEEMLRHRFAAGPEAPGLDLVLLGMGADGHTLSLFPGRDFAADDGRWCATAAAPPASPVRDRITLTLAAVARARRAVFLVAGADKAKTLAAVRASMPDGRADLPASLIRCRGMVQWLTDRAAEG